VSRAVAPKKEEKKKKEKSAKKSVDDILEDLNCGRDEEVKRLSSIIGRGKTNRGGIVVVTGDRGHGKSFMLKQVKNMCVGGGAKSLPAYNMNLLDRKDKSDSLRKMSHDNLQMYREFFTRNGEEYVAAYESSIFLTWRGILVDCIGQGAAHASMSEREWVLDAVKLHAGGAFVKDINKLYAFIPGLSVQGDANYDANAKDWWFAGEQVKVLEQMLLAVLFHYGRRMGPTVIILHLQRGTSTIGELESWSLARKASQEGKNLIVVVSTRSFLQEDRNSKTSEIAALIAMAEDKNSLLELGNFDEKNTLKLAADILSSADVQQQCGAISEGDEAYRISAEDIPPALVTLLHEVAAGNPKQIMEVLEPVLNGYKKSSAYHDYTDGKDFCYDWYIPAMTIVGHHSLEIKPELKDYLSSHYPWPAKIVGYTEQHVQELSDDLKVVLHVASIFKYGVTAELLRPFINGDGRPEDKLNSLAASGFLLVERVSRLAEDAHGIRAAKRLKALDCNAEYVYVFASKLLQKLTVSKIPHTELVHLDAVTKTAQVRCRWVKLRTYVWKLNIAKELLKKEGYLIRVPDHGHVPRSVGTVANVLIAQKAEASRVITVVEEAEPEPFFGVPFLAGAVLAVVALQVLRRTGLGSSLGL